MGFTPLASSFTNAKGFVPGFTPLQSPQEAEQPSAFAPSIETVKDIGRVYPVLETAANLATQAVALPMAGIAGLGAIASKATGLTEAEPADVVHKVAGAMTYQPQTESGQHLTGAATYPFQKLAEAGRYVGDQTLDATGSPALATAVDTVVNVAPMAFVGKPVEPKGPLTRAAERRADPQTATEQIAVEPSPHQSAVPIDAVLARSAQDAITQPDTGMPPIVEEPQAPTMPRALAADPAVLNRVAVEPQHYRNVEGVETSPNMPQPGFSPLEQIAPEFSESMRAAETSSAQGGNVKLPGHEFGYAPGVTMQAEAPKAMGVGETAPVIRTAEPQPMAIDAVPMLEGVAVENPKVTPRVQPIAEPIAETMPKAAEVMAKPEHAAITAEAAPRASGFTPLETAMPDTPVDSRAAMAPGAQYTGFADNAATAGKLTEKPIRREDVLIPLMKDLRIRVYEGRVSGKRLGFYIPKVGAVRIKHKSDLEVAAHEIAHMLDDRISAIRESWLKGDMAEVHTEELRGVSYDKGKVYEGFAEFTRLYMTQPEKAKAAAPHYYKWFDDFTKQHQSGAAIRKAQEGMTSWFRQDALHRAQSKIGAQRSLNEALDGFGDKFRQAVTDDLHGIYRMERELTGKTSPLGAYETARLTRGAGGLVDGAIRLGAPIRKENGAFDFQGKGLEKILEPVAGNLDEFLMYAVGRSSHELMLQGREKLFTPAEERSMLQLKRPEFETAFAEYQAWNNGVLDFAESMGVINKKARSMWRRSQYLPFYRVGQPSASASKGGAQGNWAGIQKLTGGTGNLRDILGNMTQNAATLIDTALKNEARAKIVKLAETQKGGGNFLVKIEADSKQGKIERDQIKEKLLEAAGIDPKAAHRGMLDAEQAKLVAQIEQQIESAPGLFEFMVHGQSPKGNILAVLEDGRPTYYEVADPLLYRAVASLNRAPQHWIIKWLGLPKRVGQMTITLTPDFMVANMARDTIMGAVMSRAGFRPFVDSAKGMASRIKQDPAYREYLANGGGFASYLRDENTFRAHLDRFYTGKGINPKTVLDTPDKLLYFTETLADAFEMSTRLGEYKRLREQGVHPREAAYLGREISTDFAMKGDSQVLGAMYDTVMFLRPAVVSMDRLYRGLAHDPNKGAIAAKAGTIAMLSAWLYWQNKDNPKYDELEDWDRDSYWHFFVPVDGKEEHFRYPKIWEVGALASVAERTVAALNEQEPEYGKSVGRILKNLFSLNLMPQIVAPLYEQATNRKSFTGAPIETPGMENMQPFLRAKPYTSETLKAAGMASRNMPENLQINPACAEALLRGYFNTWAMYGLMLSDSAFYSDTLPEKRTDELPVVRRFYSSEPAKRTKHETMFYEMLGEARRLHGTIRSLEKADRLDLADEYEDAPANDYAPELEQTSKELRRLNAEMEEVNRSSLTPGEKRAQLDALIEERNLVLRETVLQAKQ